MDAQPTPAAVVLEASTSVAVLTGDFAHFFVEVPGVLLGVRRSVGQEDAAAWSVGGWVRGQRVYVPWTGESSFNADLTFGIDYLFAGRPRHGPRLAAGVAAPHLFDRLTPFCDVSYAIEVVPARFLVVVGSWILRNDSHFDFGPYLALRLDFAFGGSSKPAPSAPPPPAPTSW